MGDPRDYIVELERLQSGVRSIFTDILASQEKYKNEIKELNKYCSVLKEKVAALGSDIKVLQGKGCENCCEVQKQLQQAENIYNRVQNKWLSLREFINGGNLQVYSDPHGVITLKLFGELINTDKQRKELENIDSQFFQDIANEFEEGKPAEIPKNKELLEEFFGYGTPESTRKEADVIVLGTEPLVQPDSGGSGRIIPETLAQDTEFWNIQFKNERTPEKQSIQTMEGSPVIHIKKANKVYSKENVINFEKCLEESPVRLVDQRLLLKPIQAVAAVMSPVKRAAAAAASLPRNSPAKRKRRSPRKLSHSSPKATMLAVSNNIEAELSASGVRKLKQTVLNTECFKKRTPVKLNMIAEEEEEGRDKALQLAISLSLEHEPKATRENNNKLECQALEDDEVIMESPNGSTKRGLLFTRPNVKSDPDVTVLSTSAVKQLSEEPVKAIKPMDVDTKPHCVTYDRLPETEDQQQQQPYKRDAVRKKAERLKLPGQDCIDCLKYYKAAGVKAEDDAYYKAMLNRCSRHRDKFEEVTTPPGYWKPYFTATQITLADLN